MNHEDLDKELDRLWAKVSSARASAESPGAPSVQFGGAAYDITLDAVSLLKKQHRREAESWAQLLEAKERALRLALERQAALESEAHALRQRLQAGEAVVMGEVVEARSTLESGMKSMEAERARFEEERRSLQGLLEETRERLSAEARRADDIQRQWEKRERRHLEELRQLQEQCASLQESSVRSDEQSRRVGDGLKEAKNALEKTLAELLAERQSRRESERERAEALAKVDEVQKHFSELSKLWEEERAQWRELWDRERSTWESQRREFSVWEEKLRKEREAWQAKCTEEERNQVAFVAKINESLRQSSETSTKVASAMKLMRGLGAASEAAAALSVGSRGRSRWAAGGLAAAIVAAAAFGVWSYLARPHPKLAATQSVSLENPTSLAFDGERLWVCEWKGELKSFDPVALTPMEVVRAKIPEPFRPVALAAGGDVLWSLDSAQARVVAHRSSRPAEVVGSRPAPGPAPAAAAADGENLWIYDAANAALYRQDAEGKASRSFSLEGMVPAAMAWADGALWAFDARTRELVALEISDTVKEKSRTRFDAPVLGMAAGKDSLWILAGPSSERPGFALQRYKY